MLKQWFKNTYVVNEITKGIVDQYGNPYGIKNRPPIICNDGFELSVQASNAHYCEPKTALKNGEYTHAEVKMHEYAKYEPLLADYMYQYDICAMVPVEIVEAVIQKHGGIKK